METEYLFQKNNVTFYGNQGLSDRIILFGIDGDKVVKVILLLAKFHIYRSRVQNGKPNYKSFLAEIKKGVKFHSREEAASWLDLQTTLFKGVYRGA